jgi:hypothetical protein
LPFLASRSSARAYPTGHESSSRAENCPTSYAFAAMTRQERLTRSQQARGLALPGSTPRKDKNWRSNDLLRYP